MAFTKNKEEDMITFFRRLRKKLLAEGNLRRYVVYAVGEIFLVMVGILLALQVNNWNQHRLLKQQETLLLEEIQQNFLFNKNELESNLGRYDRVQHNLSKIIDLFPINLQSVNLDSLASYLEKVHFIGNYDYSNTSIKKLQNAASFDIISDKELRDLLFQWEIVLADYLEIEVQAIKQHEEIFLPTISTHIPRPYYEGLRDPRMELEYLSSIQFESLIKNRRRKVGNIFGRFERSGYQNNLKEVIDKIILLSGKN